MAKNINDEMTAFLDRIKKYQSSSSLEDFRNFYLDDYDKFIE